VICFAPSLTDSIIFLTLTRLVVVINSVNFSFALFTPPPLGDFQDGNTVGGSPPRRNLSAPRLGHRRYGLLREPSPSRRLNRLLRSLNQLSPEDVSPAHGLGKLTPASVPPVDGPARLRPTKLLFEPTLPLSVLAEGSFN
jgi:hypothetical protein